MFCFKCHDSFHAMIYTKKIAFLPDVFPSFCILWSWHFRDTVRRLSFSFSPILTDLWLSKQKFTANTIRQLLPSRCSSMFLRNHFLFAYLFYHHLRQHSYRKLWNGKKTCGKNQLGTFFFYINIEQGNSVKVWGPSVRSYK